jgi:hypothetical protein
MSKFYHCSGGLTGGGAGALDAIASPADKDIAFVHFNDDATYGNGILIYTFDVDSAVGESVPYIIAPDTGAGEWELVSLNVDIVTFQGLIGHRTAVGATNYNPSALTSDYIIAMTDTAAARAVTISIEDEDSGSPTKPRIMVIKDESGGAGAHHITVTLESGGNIDGAASYAIDQNYQCVSIYMDGTNAWIY